MNASVENKELVVIFFQHFVYEKKLIKNWNTMLNVSDILIQLELNILLSKRPNMIVWLLCE